MSKLVSAIAIALVLGVTACTSVLDDGYQIGDATIGTLEAIDNYCTAATPAERNAAMIVLQSFDDDADESICVKFGYTQ